MLGAVVGEVWQEGALGPVRAGELYGFVGRQRRYSGAEVMWAAEEPQSV